MASFASAAAELLGLVALAAAEKTKRAPRTQPAKVAAITKALRTIAHDEERAFASPKGRNDFLCAAASYLAPLDHEELLVAFGTRRGRARNAGASLRSVHRTIGLRASVTPTAKLIARLEGELERDGAEVILVHNHPSNLVKTLIAASFAWIPIASTPDRALALALLRTRLFHVLTSPRPSSLKWYLVDEGQVEEFILPPPAVLLGWLARSP